MIPYVLTYFDIHFVLYNTGTCQYNTGYRILKYIGLFQKLQGPPKEDKHIFT